jgi:hypothetical protein
MAYLLSPRDLKYLIVDLKKIDRIVRNCKHIIFHRNILIIFYVLSFDLLSNMTKTFILINGLTKKSVISIENVEYVF